MVFLLNFLHTRTLFTVIMIYALYHQVSLAFLQTSSIVLHSYQSSPIHTPTECLTTTRTSSTTNRHCINALTDQEYTNNHNSKVLFKTRPLTKPESVCWAFQQNLDSRHALTHSLFIPSAVKYRPEWIPCCLFTIFNEEKWG